MKLKLSKELYIKPKRAHIPLKAIVGENSSKERFVVVKSIVVDSRPKADASVSSEWFSRFKKSAKSRFSLEKDNLNF